jgi:hypothetical protein
MGDLITPYNDPAMPAPGLDGDSITSRGGDPLIDTGGTSGLQPVWGEQPVPTPGGSETDNPVSGLPRTPSRWEPTDTPPQPPDLTDRNPGTI